LSGDRSPIAIYQNAFLIYNPFAGQLNGKDHLLQRTIDVLAAGGHRVTPTPTTGPQMAHDLAQECIDGGADAILALGGDGTVNEVVNGMIGSSVPLGVLPAGTANVLACELGIGTNMLRAGQQLDAWAPVRIAVGRKDPGKRHFVLMAGAGFDALVVHRVDTSLKRRFGKVAYWVSGFGQFGKRLAQLEVHTNGRTVRCSFALASRVRNYGGDLTIARGASLLRDEFELVLFEGATTVPYLKYFTGVLTGTLKHIRGATVVTSREVEITPVAGNLVHLQIDGEIAGVAPTLLRIVPDALTLLVPRRFRSRG
jgi:diacylglycerol kinase (ATP)